MTSVASVADHRPGLEASAIATIATPSPASRQLVAAREPRPPHSITPTRTFSNPSAQGLPDSPRETAEGEVLDATGVFMKFLREHFPDDFVIVSSQRSALDA